ncbi:hypothetical protein LTR66_017577 [Elasticomyces elasticus]|nr:hypothetical protein LTR66_017577 [Elasticomyces elasticus]KAK4950509.1 hypothetical protein LTR28_007065 [Elasticomyces elasticus]
MSVNSLVPDELRAAVAQIVNSSRFVAANPHLTKGEVASIQRDLDWPALKPVFSPFAQTHDGYSQVRFKGVKYLCHRLTFAEYNDGTPIGVGEDISHTCYVGPQLTARNINPIQLCAEPNDINQARKACFLYLERELDRFRAGGDIWPGGQGPRDASVEDMAARIRGTQILCRELHREQECSFCYEVWLQDRFERAGLRPPSARFESDEEASQRLE